MTTTKQITVRLDEGLVKEMDQAVEDGTVGSRAAYVEAALRAQHRARRQEHELAVLDALEAAGESLYPDLAGMHAGRSYADLDA